MTGRSPEHNGAEEDFPVAMPPVRLLPDKELARLALESPVLGTAVRLARWSAPGLTVGDDGVLGLEDARRAVRELDLLPEDCREPVLAEMEHADELEELDLPWAVADELGLLAVDAGTAEPGRTLDLLSTATPGEILDLWWEAAEIVLTEACLAVQDDELLAALAAQSGGDGDGGERWAAGDDGPEEPDVAEVADLLYNALENLYLISALEAVPGPRSAVRDALFTASRPGEVQDRPQPVPLPVLAASMVVPEEMEAPTDEALEEVSDLMMRLDSALQLVAGSGIVEYRPVDPTVVDEDSADGGSREQDADRPGGWDAGEGDDGAKDDHAGRPAGSPVPGGAEDVIRYGMVTLTPLGTHGVRRHLLATGAEAPAIGELADAQAADLLDAMARYPDEAARVEAETWLSGRNPLTAARELLAAARGEETWAPLRRLYCQQVLALLGPEADTALREVLDDPHLGGLARVRLAERGAEGVPQASERMIFWLTVDTLAAQLADEEVLQELLHGIALGQDPEAFFAGVWQVDHPATADVLDAVGRLHPDRIVAKEARKAAYRARSRTGR